MGGVRTTTQNLTVHAVDNDANVILVKGAIPGPAGGLVLVRSANKGAPKKGDLK
jgi:large subunit ribosomal protein L3